MPSWRAIVQALARGAAVLGLAVSGTTAACAQDSAPDGTWFSPLATINPATLMRLERLADRSLGSPAGQGGAVAQAGDSVVAQTPFPHAVLALPPQDAARTRWRYDPPADLMAKGQACCNPGRQPVSLGDRLVLATLDGHVTVLEAGTGAVVWDRVVADSRAGETLAGEPVPVGGRILIGNAGEDAGARGWIAALDAGDGHEIWRRYTTGPDVDVGIGPDFRPALARDNGRDLGVSTWPPGAFEHGGGAVSGPILVDEEAGLVIHGTGRPAPGNPSQRPGDNLWTSGLMARSLADGTARWFVGLNRHDRFGYGGTGPTMLVRRDWQGAARRLVLHVDANGLFYVIDGQSGEVLAADAYTDITAHDGLDVETGALRHRADKEPRENRVARGVCPASPSALKGGAAYSPLTGLAYLAVDRSCMDFEARRTGHIGGTPYLGTNLRLRQPPAGPRGELVAWDVAARKRVWSVPEDFPVAGGVLATAGGLVFYGTLDGAFKAVDARTGQVLWTRRLPAGTVAQPVALRRPDGSEMIAILSGLPGPLGLPTDQDIDVRDATAASGAAHELADLPERTGQGAALSFFGLR